MDNAQTIDGSTLGPCRPTQDERALARVLAAFFSAFFLLIGLLHALAD